MKRLISIVLLLIVITSCRKDLVRWQLVQQIETGTTEDQLNKILFLSDSVGLIIGGQRFNNSTVLRTTDGGKSWDYQNITEAPKALYGITQAPSGTLYAVGFDGKLLQSFDKGKSWLFYQTWYLPYKDLGMFSDTGGILIGGISFYAGYQTYFTQEGTFSNWDSLGYEMNDIEVVDNQKGYMAAYGNVLKTVDGGKSWVMLEVKNDNFMAIHAYNKIEAWTCGYNGSIFYTKDEGKTWEEMRNGNDFSKPRYRLLDIAAGDAMHIYAVGENGLFIYSDDGGHHWMEMERFTSGTLRSIAVKKNGAIFVCGDKGELYLVKPKPF